MGNRDAAGCEDISLPKFEKTSQFDPPEPIDDRVWDDLDFGEDLTPAQKT